MEAKALFNDIALALKEGDLEKAKTLFFSNRETLYESNPLLTLKTNFELRFIAEEFEEAYMDNEYFQSLPYVSQEMEESLRSIPSLIRANELSLFTLKPLKEDEAMAMLNGKKKVKNEELLYTLSKIQKEADIKPYEEGIVALLRREDVHDDVKSFGLMLLSQRLYQREVVLNKHGRNLNLKPALIGSPFGNASYNEIRKRLELGKDTSLNEIGIKLLDQFALYRYPEKPLLGTLEETIDAINEVAKAYLYGDKVTSELGKNLDELLKSQTPLS